MAASSLTTEEVDGLNTCTVSATHLHWNVYAYMYISELHCFNLPLQWDFISLVWINCAATAERVQCYTQIYVDKQ